jgi:hypothetical protein
VVLLVATTGVPGTMQHGRWASVLPHEPLRTPVNTPLLPDPHAPRIGTIYLSTTGQGVGTFEFVVDREAGVDVQIGSAVAADTEEGVRVGSVVDMRIVGHIKDPHVAVRLSAGSNVIDSRHPSLVATVALFGSDVLRPTTNGAVRAATPGEMFTATGSRDVEWGVPAGCVTLLDGSHSPVHLDGHSLLGDQAAHLTVAGLSGMASKTSFASFLLASAIAHGSPDTDSVGGLIFNVKGHDYLNLDKAPDEKFRLKEEDRELYEAMGVPAEPFQNVVYYAPADTTTAGARSNRSDASSLCWSLADVWNDLVHLIPNAWGDENFGSLLAILKETKIRPPRSDRSASPVAGLGGLIGFLDDEIALAEERAAAGETGVTCFGGTHLATVRKAKRQFQGIQAKVGGLIAKDATTSLCDIDVTGWEHGKVVVVDLDGLSSDVAGFVIAHTVDRLLKASEGNVDGVGVDHLAVLCDEANQWAPQGGDTTSVKRTLRTLVLQGRYAGMSAWLMGQKASRLDETIREQSSTYALGRCSPTELSSGVYGKITPGLQEQIVTLRRGQMMLWHYTLRAPLVVRFPRPAWKTGKPTEAFVRNNVAKRSGLSAESGKLIEAAVGAERAGEFIDAHGDAAVEEFQAELRTQGPRGVQAKPVAFDPDNPFNLD